MKNATPFFRSTAALATLAGASRVAFATETDAAVTTGAVVGAREILNTGLSLLLIVGAIMALAWAYSRLQGGRARNGGVIRILAAQPLGAKERVMLVDVAGRQLVIGVTASQIQTLHVLDEAIVPTETPRALTGGFAERLRAALQGASR